MIKLNNSFMSLYIHVDNKKFKITNIYQNEQEANKNGDIFKTGIIATDQNGLVYEAEQTPS